MKISLRTKGQLIVSYQVVTDPCCGLSIIFCGFILHLIGHETINIPEIFSSVHGFTVSSYCVIFFFLLIILTFGIFTNEDIENIPLRSHMLFSINFLSYVFFSKTPVSM